ncbi:hypothetical protein BKA62DRAFT_693887 [Auriculariales sp. MPI-PUGE-AT-0066]|nr:hypothetical protein BKA62DRAFT_693887 [Auriculariales sp. MPI-PUGE-AT-0066]
MELYLSEQTMSSSPIVTGHDVPAGCLEHQNNASGWPSATVAHNGCPSEPYWPTAWYPDIMYPYADWGTTFDNSAYCEIPATTSDISPVEPAPGLIENLYSIQSVYNSSKNTPTVVVDGKLTSHQLPSHTWSASPTCTSPIFLMTPSNKAKSKLSVKNCVHVCPAARCGMKFLRRYDLNRHMRSHSNSRLYACFACGKRYLRSDALKRHWNASPICDEEHVQELYFLLEGMHGGSGDLLLLHHNSSHKMKATRAVLEAMESDTRSDPK